MDEGADTRAIVSGQATLEVDASLSATHTAAADDRAGAWMKAGVPAQSLEEQRALGALEARLFGVPAQPLRFARYLLLDRLGQGGEGLVYEAYDPTLQRGVAIKLMSSRADADGEGAQRMLAEAQSLARLSHPNVVPIYDAQRYDDEDLPALDEGARSEIPRRGVFIVMERLRGPTLREWALGLDPGHRRDSGKAPDARAKGRVLAQVGRGLVAAHEAGLVHRDFKPDNVIVARHGEAKVVDFGLAAPIDPAVIQIDAGALRLVKGGSNEPAALRAAGSIVGTPAYMAPEQHRGLPADARSDQYAFACTIFEVLTGTRPFAATSLESLRLAKEARAIGWPPRHDLSRSMVQALERALSPNPQARWPTLKPLLDALDPAPRRGRWGALVGTLGLSAGLAAWLGTPGSVAKCVQGVERVDSLWGQGRSLAVERALRASDLSYADSTWRRVDRSMQSWSAQWTDARRVSCSRLGETQSPQDANDLVVAKELQCLDRRLVEARAVADMLAETDASLVQHANALVDDLEPPQSCLHSLREDDSRPADPAMAAQLARARALRLAGKYSDAKLRLDELELRAGAADAGALLARVRFESASIDLAQGHWQASESAYFEALLAAQRLMDPELEADCWNRLAWVVGVELGDGQRGERYARLAEAALVPLGVEERRAADLDHTRGGLAYARQDFEAALAFYRRALQRYAAALGDQHPWVARTHNHIANVLISQKRWDEARVQASESLRLRKSALGETHPLLAASHNNLAVVAMGRAEHDRAQEHLDAALALSGSQQGAAYRVTTQLLAELSVKQGRFGDALSYYEAQQRWLDAHAIDSMHERAQIELAIDRLRVRRTAAERSAANDTTVSEARRP